MGYWFQGAGFRNPDASWAPGLAYVAFDSDFRLGDNPGASSNKVVFTMGSWWPKFGYFEKYDTYTLGRFRQLGEQLELTVPLDPYLTDYSVVLTEGLAPTGTVALTTGLRPSTGPSWADHLVERGACLQQVLRPRVALQHRVDLGYPNLEQQSAPGAKSYGAAADAHLTVAGAGDERTHTPPRAFVALSVLHLGPQWLGAGQRRHRGHELAGRSGHRYQLHGMD